MAGRVGGIVAGVVAVALASPGLIRARPAGDAPLAPEAVKPLQSVAKELAAAGRGEELSDVLDLLRRAGMEAADFSKFSSACERDAAKVKSPAPSLPSSAKSLQRIAADLATRLPSCGDAERIELARIVVRIDATNEAAEQALGREKAGDEWLDALGRTRRAGALALSKALEQARALDVKLAVGPSSDPILAGAKSVSRNVVRADGIEVHGVWPADRLSQVVRQSARALAVVNFLLTGECRIPALPKLKYVLFESRAEHGEAVDRLRQEGKISAELLPLVGRMDVVQTSSGLVGYKLLAADAEAEIVSRAARAIAWKSRETVSLENTQPALTAGVINWCCLSFLGTRLPLYLYQEEKTSALGGDGTAGSSSGQRELRERLLLLSEAGICGGRAWMQFLVDRHEDPPLVDVFADQLGKIQKDRLLKATLVVEMLAQERRLFDVCRKMTDAATASTLLPLLERGLGAPIGRFETDWREWLAPPKASLVVRLAAPVAKSALREDERAALDALVAIRKAAGLADLVVDFDRAASDACRKHVRYLLANPDQLNRWPAVHEENPDLHEFDPAGAWAGARSVIASGVKDGPDALAGWMATLYHRIPLIEPGLVRIGFACDKGCAVLDSGSFVRPRRGPLKDNHPSKQHHADPAYWAVLWPPAGGVSIPTHYAQEQPQPVPGQECSSLGFPITFELRETYVGPREVTLELHAGDARGPIVPCWFSTPTNPLNPVIVLDDVWCLIPKQPLRAGAYTVTGTLHIELDENVDESFSWSFRCGK